MHVNGIYLCVSTNLFLVNKSCDTLSLLHLTQGDLDLRVLEIGFVNSRCLFLTSNLSRQKKRRYGSREIRIWELNSCLLDFSFSSRHTARVTCILLSKFNAAHTLRKTHGQAEFLCSCRNIWILTSYIWESQTPSM